MDLTQILDTAIEAANAAGRLQRARFGASFTISHKAEKDLVTEVDTASEDIITGMIRERFPEHGILAEEGKYQESASPWRWIIDPIDGTTNFAHGYPWFSVSIGVEQAGTMVAGVIYNPVAEHLFTAVRGGGAFLNGRRIRVSSRAPLSASLLATGFPYDCAVSEENNFDNFTRFQRKARGIRRAGCASLDLAWVAAGGLDGFWELKLKPWDVAAGWLVTEEAGGRVTTFDGGDYNLSSHRILASNGLIHKEMQELLAEDKGVQDE